MSAPSRSPKTRKRIVQELSSAPRKLAVLRPRIWRETDATRLITNYTQPTPLDCHIDYSDDNGWEARHGRYAYSETLGFLIDGIALQTIDSLFFPHVNTNPLFIFSRYTNSEHNLHFYNTQLEHRGLSTTYAKEVAKLRLIAADDKMQRDIHLTWLRDQLKIHLEHALAWGPSRLLDSRCSFGNRISLTPDAQVITEGQSLNESRKSYAETNERWLEYGTEPHQHVLLAKHITSKYSILYPVPEADATQQSAVLTSVSDLVIVCDTDVGRAYGRFRVRDRVHGIFTFLVPPQTSSDAVPIDIAFEDCNKQDGSWQVLHGHAFRGTCWIILADKHLLRLGSAFDGLSYAKDAALKKNIFAVRQTAPTRDKTVDSDLDGEIDIRLIRRAWNQMHKQYCKSARCHNTAKTTSPMKQLVTEHETKSEDEATLCGDLEYKHGMNMAPSTVCASEYNDSDTELSDCQEL